MSPDPVTTLFHPKPPSTSLLWVYHHSCYPAWSPSHRCSPSQVATPYQSTSPSQTVLNSDSFSSTAFYSTCYSIWVSSCCYSWATALSLAWFGFIWRSLYAKGPYLGCELLTRNIEWLMTRSLMMMSRFHCSMRTTFVRLLCHRSYQSPNRHCDT